MLTPAYAWSVSVMEALVKTAAGIAAYAAETWEIINGSPREWNCLRNETSCPLPLYPTLQRGNVHTVEPRLKKAHSLSKSPDCQVISTRSKLARWRARLAVSHFSKALPPSRGHDVIFYGSATIRV